MKKGLFLAFAALAVAVFAVPDAHAWWWGHHNRPDINLHAWGGLLTSSDEGGFPTPIGAVAEGEALTSLATGNTRGRSGSPSFFASTSVAGLSMNPLDSPPDCLAAGLVGAPLFQTIVLTYRDGSLLSLIAGPESFYCTDGEIFTVNASGEIAAGDGRFEGATGSFEVKGRTLPPGGTGLITADISIHFE
jgi:hypothetical protein